MYILAADTLSKLFTKGRRANLVRGLGPPCVENTAITNYHYVDDTILFLEAHERNVEAAWWTMLAFEAISGIKMNYDKTELYSINVDVDSAIALQQIFRCQVGGFPNKIFRFTTTL